MAQQQIITKPFVGELQNGDSLFINHDGALRQVSVPNADLARHTEIEAEIAAREEFEEQEVAAREAFEESEIAAREEFEEQEVAAREAFEESETAAREEFEADVQEQMAEKANVDGYYEEMTVGDAEQLVATQFVEDEEPYLFRSTGGPADVGNRAYLDAIIGGTVAWNQLFDYDSTVLNVSGLTIEKTDNGTYRFNGTRSTTSTGNIAYPLQGGGHVYYFRSGRTQNDIVLSNTYNWKNENEYLIRPNNEFRINLRVNIGTYTDADFVPQIFDLTKMLGATIADYVYSLEQATAGAGIAWFRKLFPASYYGYNAGEFISVEGLESHNTVGFNQWDEEVDLGILNSDGSISASSNRLVSKNFIPVIEGQTYYMTKFSVSSKGRGAFYDADHNLVQYLSDFPAGNMNVWTFTVPSGAAYLKFCLPAIYGITYKDDICINFSYSGYRNGEYEEYVKHSYLLDNSITLRGIPKLDTSNNLYFDGDTYEPDGTVNGRFKIDTYDGSEAWTKDTDISSGSTTIHRFYLSNDNIKKYTNYVDRMLANKCETTNNYQYASSMVGDFAVTGYSITSNNYNWMYIFSKTIDTVEGIKAWLAEKPLQVLYELTTPTTEEAEPYQHIQIVDDFGTEEFVSNSIVPVGHMTEYPANLRDKLQHLPDPASMDGTYIIQQNGKQMSLVYMPAVFPEIPTEDGTYTLKTVVASGVATLQWVAD